MTSTASKDPTSLILAIADMARSNPPLVSSFVAELARHLQGQGPALALPLTWIEQRLSESSLTIEQLVRAENQQQAADQVSMSNSIGSLRFLGSMDWREFVETMSVVEQVLREIRATSTAGWTSPPATATGTWWRGPPGAAAYSETDVARLAVQLAREGAAREGDDSRAAHVGYYLIDDGFAQLERAVADAARRRGDVLGRLGRRFPLLWYGGAIVRDHAGARRRR